MNWSEGLWLELLGSRIDGYSAGPEQSMGERIWLKPGLLLMENEALGLINMDPIPLQDTLLRSPWILNGYRFTQGRDTAELRLSYGMTVDRPIYPSIPPGAIQPDSQSQPLFELMPLALQRNPCPGYRERVFLYRTLGAPFSASAVMYLDADGLLGSAELFDQTLLHREGDYARRCWLRFYR
jgi:hypothetical protein